MSGKSPNQDDFFQTHTIDNDPSEEVVRARPSCAEGSQRGTVMARPTGTCSLYRTRIDASLLLIRPQGHSIPPNLRDIDPPKFKSQLHHENKSVLKRESACPRTSFVRVRAQRHS